MSSCFDTGVLREFRYGTLNDDAQTDAIAEHLPTCSICQLRFGAIPDQPLVQWLFRRSASPDLTPQDQPLKPTQDWGGAPPPQALLDHPKWECLRLLGKGGIGAAYLVRQRQFPDRLRAIKILQPQLKGDAHLAERFRREVLVTLDQLPAHENIVRGYDAEVLTSYLLLVVEYVPGENLERLASQQPGGRLDYRRACGYMLQALAGLAHATRHGVVHRDFKPSNLMLSTDGTVKILDFGLAKVLSDVDSALTSSQVEFCGTAKYCSPEQANSFAKADLRSDLYSLGCTLYRLIAGVPPFGEHTGHTSALAVFQAHHLDVPRQLAELCPQVPAELSRVVAKLLSKDANDRYQSAPEAMADLVPFADAESQAKYRSSSLLRGPEVFDASPAKKQLVHLYGYGTGVVAMLLLVGIALWQMGYVGSRRELPVAPTATTPHPVNKIGPTPPATGVSRLAAAARTSGGIWRVEGSELIVRSSGEEFLLFGDPQWTDYTFTFEVKRETGDEAVSAAFRSRDDGQLYAFTLGANHNQARTLELVERSQAVTAVESAPDPESLKQDHWHRVKVEITGDRVTCLLDGLKKFDFEGLAAERGRVGLLAKGVTARFRNLRVMSHDGKTLWTGLPELPAEPPPENTGQNPAKPPVIAPNNPGSETELPPDLLVLHDDDEPQLYGQATWSDYDFSCKFQLGPKSSDIEFFCRATDGENAVAITLGALGNNQHEMDLIIDGRRSSQSHSETGTLSSGWHDVLIHVRGDQVQCHLDGRMILELAQSARKTGKVGLAIGKGQAAFRDLRVMSADGETLWEKK